ncbi:tigger transposable element-derived protein 1-like [Ischnura elegans]|uniref:tigger transposable element-derived protein 1-like n=1 Tax=Ischnura elegans TaxID=197161 RepID=UPI001ED86D35|nr:tigger transposable element-derived protein 1-like [Ischnura elegans]
MADKRRSESKSGASKRRRTITLEEKIDIVKKYESGLTISNISRLLNMAVSTINTIVKDKERIKEHVKGSACMRSTIITKQRNCLLAEMEKLLTVWMEEQHGRGTPLSFLTIQNKAKSLYELLKKQKGEKGGNFVASNGWFYRFKNRWNLHNVKLCGEAASGDREAAENFPKVLEKIIEEGGYLSEQVFNVDETGLFWKIMPHCTFISKEEKSAPGFKAAKDRLTLLLGGNAMGDCKLTPLLIYHSEKPRALKHVDKSSLPVIWNPNPKAWVTSALFEDWYCNHFIPEVKEYCHKKRIPLKILLILDNAPGYPAHLDDLNEFIKVIFLPPNTTSLLQPMEQGVIALFKAYYLRKTFADAIATRDGDGGMTLGEFWKGYNVYHAIKNIASSWEEVTSKNMNGVWKNLCPSLVHFEGFMSNEVDEVIDRVVDLAHALDLEVEAEDVEELLDSHEGWTNEDLIELSAYRADVGDDDDDSGSENEVCGQPKCFTAQGLSEVFEHINSAVEKLEKMDSNIDRFAKVSRALQDAMSCYEEIYREKKKASIQTSLHSFFTKVDSTSASAAADVKGDVTLQPPTTQ